MTLIPVNSGDLSVLVLALSSSNRPDVKHLLNKQGGGLKNSSNDLLVTPILCQMGILRRVSIDINKYRLNDRLLSRLWSTTSLKIKFDFFF